MIDGRRLRFHFWICFSALDFGLNFWRTLNLFCKTLLQSSGLSRLLSCLDLDCRYESINDDDDDAGAACLSALLAYLHNKRINNTKKTTKALKEKTNQIRERKVWSYYEMRSLSHTHARARVCTERKHKLFGFFWFICFSFFPSTWHSCAPTQCVKPFVTVVTNNSKNII